MNVEHTVIAGVVTAAFLMTPISGYYRSKDDDQAECKRRSKKNKTKLKENRTTIVTLVVFALAYIFSLIRLKPSESFNDTYLNFDSGDNKLYPKLNLFLLLTVLLKDLHLIGQNLYDAEWCKKEKPGALFTFGVLPWLGITTVTGVGFVYVVIDKSNEIVVTILMLAALLASLMKLVIFVGDWWEAAYAKGEKK